MGILNNRTVKERTEHLDQTGRDGMVQQGHKPNNKKVLSGISKVYMTLKIANADNSNIGRRESHSTSIEMIF